MFESVEGMLKWAGLYNLTTTTLGEKLVEVGLSPILIQELATVRCLLSLVTFILHISCFILFIDQCFHSMSC